MVEPRFLAFDLGAESGRVVVGTLAEGRLSLEEIHRFPNEPVEIAGTLHWDILSLHHNVLKGMTAYVQQFGDTVAGVGLDSWSVDFGLLAADGNLLQNPVHYRDARTEGMVKIAARQLPPERLFQLTGIGINQIHTVFQLLSLRQVDSPVLKVAATFLMIPDLLAYFLTGAKFCERTNASHTQLWDPHTRQWAEQVFTALDLPPDLMPPLIDPGTILGPLRESVSHATGLREAAVVAPCTHDTASAVAAVPAPGDDWALLSSGTWSILGALTEQAITSPQAFAARINNELALDSFFVCRNIMGMWLLQQCRLAWEREGHSYSYEELIRLAEQAPPGGPLVYPDHPSFLAPEDMPSAIREYCAATGQRPPEDVAALTRCILESLALCYRYELEQMAEIVGHEFSVLHVVGGGSLNTLLCQMTAEALGIPVIAGPVEATVMGNVLVQALALGYISSAQEIREVVRASTTLREYEPRHATPRDEQYERYRNLAG